MLRATDYRALHSSRLILPKRRAVILRYIFLATNDEIRRHDDGTRSAAACLFITLPRLMISYKICACVISACSLMTRRGFHMPWQARRHFRSAREWRAMNMTYYGAFTGAYCDD